MKNLYVGWHLIYDAIVEPEHAAKLVDLDHLEQVLRDLVELLEMEILVEPILRDVPLDPSKEDDLDDGGVTGVVVLTTSHIAIHTWPLRSRFSVDVFSCREFDQERVQEFLKGRFNVKLRSSHWIVRNWP